MNERGTALIATLSVLMVLLPIGAFVALQCRTDLMIQRNLRAEVEAFYVAEAGLEHAIAEVAPAQSFDDLLRGPDGAVGTADDGLFPFVEGAPGEFPRSPCRYEVRVAKGARDTIRLVSQSVGAQGAMKTVAATVGRSALTYTPASLYAEGDVTRLDLGDAGFVLSGLDHRADGTRQSEAAAAPIPAFGTPSADAESSLRRQLLSGATDRLVGAGGSPSIAPTPLLALPAYVSRILSRPERVTLSAVNEADDVVIGTAAAPQLTVVAGDLAVAGSLNGSGILVVQGSLVVTGKVAFTGLVLALGGIAFASESNVNITGSLWRAASPDQRLDFRGAGSILYSSSALAAADSALPGILAHALTVTGWQEQL